MTHHNKRVGPTDTFYLAFDTLTYPGKIAATAITVRTEIVSDDTRKFRIDFMDHPLFRSIAHYCVSNLSDADLQLMLADRRKKGA